MPSSFAASTLAAAPPLSFRANVQLPRRESYFASPVDWRKEVLYFLLVDRFSDGQEGGRPLVDRTNPASQRPNSPVGQSWQWNEWSRSGGDRWQGGTLKGVESKLGYLKDLGVTTIWLSPVFRQRGHLDTYHGYGIQNFLDVDPRFGTRKDLVELVEKAHAKGLRILLDIIFNHSGFNWLYPGNVEKAAFRPFPGFYPFGAWLDGNGNPVATATKPEEGVWPSELQGADCYTRAGTGSLGGDDIANDHAEHKRTDFENLRDFALDNPGVLDFLVDCYKYWIALSDCDGFRIDTLKHVSFEEGRNFCGAIKEFAGNLGKLNFFLVGEVAGGDHNEDRYLDVIGQNLNAALDIGGMRPTLNSVAKGIAPASSYFDGFDPGRAEMGSHRNLGQRHVSILDDHDHVFGEKIRFSSEAASPQQVVAGVATQLFTLGIPCVYYGTEQSFAGPEPAERTWLPGWKGSDRYLREAMFGPRHPRKGGLGGTSASPLDTSLPGFGPFGTAGAHCFDPSFTVYRQIAALGAVRKGFPVLSLGRQYPRPVSNFGGPFVTPAAGELFAWSRVLSDEEALVVVNGHGTQPRGGDVIVDAGLATGAMKVVANSAETGQGSAAGLSHPIGSTLPVQHRPDGTAFVAIRNVPPSAVLVLTNHP